MYTWNSQCSVQPTPNIQRHIGLHRSADSIIFSSAFAGSRVQPSVPNSERPSFILRSLFIPLSFQISTRSSILFLAIPIRDLMYLLQLLPSADFSYPRCLKCSTNSICSSTSVTPASDCISPIFRSLVFFTFNFSTFAFPMLQTFPLSLSASSCDSAQSAVSSYAYLRLETNFPPILIPSSSIFASRTTDSVYKLKSGGESIQPCLTLLSILHAITWRPSTANWSV